MKEGDKVLIFHENKPQYGVTVGILSDIINPYNGEAEFVVTNEDGCVRLNHREVSKFLDLDIIKNTVIRKISQFQKCLDDIKKIKENLK